jgi:hypothetical protein
LLPIINVAAPLRTSMPGHSTSAFASAAAPASPDVAFDEVLNKSNADVLNTLVELQPARPSAKHINAVAATGTVTARLIAFTTIPRFTCGAMPLPGYSK